MPRRGARRRAGGDGERVLGRRCVHAADGDRPAHRRAAGVRRRARARLAERARRPGAVDAAAARRRRARDRERARRTRRSGSAPDGPRVVELAARLGGGHDAELCRAALGVDLNALALDAALGGGPRTCNVCAKSSSPVGGACVVFLVAPEGDARRAVDGVDEARAVEGVLDAHRLPAARPRLRAAPPRGRPRRARSSPSARAATTRSRAPVVRRRAYASRSHERPTRSPQDRLPAARGRRGGDRGRRRGDPLRLAHDRPSRGRARGAACQAYLEAEHVLAVASGTAAMHLCLVALGIGPGDEVITTPITWPATANVIVHAGATPVFVDVRDGDLNIDPELAAAAVDGTDEGDPAGRPRRPAVRPRPAARARAAGGRGRRARDREPLPRPQGRLDRRRDLLLALRDEERGRRRGRPDRDRPRRRSPTPSATCA